MNKLKFLVSLTVAENDYQQQQATLAQEAARRLGVDVQVLFAGNDAVHQSQQLLEVIQSPASRPEAIICHPVGTTMVQVAREAVAAGIGWGLLNRDDQYIAELRKTSRVPVCNVNVDHEEVGRIQGRQFAALLPQGGLVLYILGAAANQGVQLRTNGMEATKPENVQLRKLRGDWTEQSAYKSVEAWLRLSTSRETPLKLVAAQNDQMAVGARKALEDNSRDEERERWSTLPYIGCDACPQTGQAWVRSGLLTASVVLPSTAGLAVEVLARAIQSKSQPTERTLLTPTSFPAVETLTGKRPPKSAAKVEP